jgi:hypothetical protein
MSWCFFMERNKASLVWRITHAVQVLCKSVPQLIMKDVSSLGFCQVNESRVLNFLKKTRCCFGKNLHECCQLHGFGALLMGFTCCQVAAPTKESQCCLVLERAPCCSGHPLERNTLLL